MIFGWLRRFFFGRSISPEKKKYFLLQLHKIQTLPPHEQIIKCDILYHSILQELGYLGSFGEILKRNPKEIPNIQEIWELHKLRNRLVHELGEFQKDFTYEAQKYILHIKKILEKIGK